MADATPASRRSPTPYLPCEAENSTVGFHPVRSHRGQIWGEIGDPFFGLIVHPGVHNRLLGKRGEKYIKIKERNRLMRLLPRRGLGSGGGGRGGQPVSAHLRADRRDETTAPSVE